MNETYEFLKSDLAEARFAAKGQLGEASRAIEPILHAFETADPEALPERISMRFRAQLESEIAQLKQAGLRRVLRIASPRFTSSQGKNGLGFARFTEASRQWRECELEAAVLDRYYDLESGACVTEVFDEHATLTLRQSCHIRASEPKKGGAKAEAYTRGQYRCPSCGAQLTRVADSTVCPYCGAVITLRFFDWQLDGFYADLRKAPLLGGAKEAAVKTAVGLLWLLSKITELLSGAFAAERRAERRGDALPQNDWLGAVLTVFLVLGLLLFCALAAMPWYARLALGVLAAAAAACGVVKYLGRTEQARKKQRIVRYSDAYLRSCVYDEVQKEVGGEALIDFSLDGIRLKSVVNTETATTVEVEATVIKKSLTPKRGIACTAEERCLTLSRARYPERRKSKGKTLEEKACPSCGANFEPDENHCCAYCGYGLKLENYVWRRV